jgi:protoporphyrinogen/coproporphyrinogen III oxidase
LSAPSVTAVVVGGGITGLVAARELARELSRDSSIVLLEASGRLGGKILTTELDGAVVEAGPDWFLTRSPAALELCDELGLTTEVVRPQGFGTLIWSRGALRRVPAGFVRGLPSSPLALLRSDLLSVPGRFRGIADVVLPGPLSGPDVSVGSLVRRRLGNELLERVVDPVLAGSRAGRADDMSLAVGAPEIDAAARSARSLILGVRKLATSGPPPFAGLAPGMSALVERLRTELEGVHVRLGVAVRSVTAAGSRYRVGLGSGETLDADGIVVAVPSHSAAGIVDGLDSDLARELRSFKWASATVASLLYPAGAVTPPPAASGFLVPSVEHKTLTACAWYTSKWANARPRRGGFVLRCFAGRSAGDATAELDDDELCRRITAEVGEATGIAAAPEKTSLTRWDRALPQFEVGHLDRTGRIERLVEKYGGIALAGAGYRGSGLTDCISGGRAAARRVAREVFQAAR